MAALVAANGEYGHFEGHPRGWRFDAVDERRWVRETQAAMRAQGFYVMGLAS